MGYRSTFTTDEYEFELPEWYVEKYAYLRYREEDGGYKLPISSNWESKFYDGARDPRFVDLARVLRESKDEYKPQQVVIALLHEDGLIDRVIVFPDKVILQRSLEAPEDGYNPQFVHATGEVYEIPLK